MAGPGTSFGSFFETGGDDGGEDSTANAFTFSLLGQLKDSLVTYDNSLKGFLDLGKTDAAPADDDADGDGSETKDGAKQPRRSRNLTPKKDRVAEELEKQLEEQKLRYQRELEEAKQTAEQELQKVKDTSLLETEARLKDSEEKALELRREREAMEANIVELESVKVGKEEMNKKVQRLQRGWAVEREQAELVKQAMSNQHRQELESVKAAGREKMAAMQTELVQTMEMLEKMYTGWQTSLEEALTEMRISSEAERKQAVEKARTDVQRHLTRAEADFRRLKEQYQVEQTRRKAAHNKLIELMGNIRVICRVRPINKTELRTGLGQDCTAYPAEAPDENIIIKQPLPSKKKDTDSSEGSSRGKKKPQQGGEAAKDDRSPEGGAGDDALEAVGSKFEFDSVLGPTSTQQQVFDELKPLVTSCMDGFSVTIFAYGQTGSGKTYTMEGGDKPDGLCYRTFDELFKVRDERCASGRMSFTFTASMLEIYNEQVRDLLVDPAAAGAAGTPMKGGKGGGGPRSRNLDIRATATGSDVPGLSTFEVHSSEEVTAMMKKGNAARAVGGHSMNERSSRSHSCIRILVQGENLDKGSMFNAKLYLIDLAGSERVAKTDATGERLKEAQNINKSLSALGNVMQALGKRSKKASKAASGGTGGEGGGEDKMSHVPFRDSKLTYLLQDSLSGGSKVLMFVNVSPAAYNYSETLSSLLFASRCRAIELGKATKNEESGEALQMRRDMAKLKKAVADAKAEIDAKVEKLNAAEKREMVLSQQVASTAEDAKAMKGSAAARQQEHQDRLERMMDEKVLREEELASVRGELESSLASLESREDDLANTQKAVAEIQQELDETREAKVAAELSAHSLGAELKVRTKQLGDAQALAARSETQAVSTVKNKLHTAEQREKEATDRVKQLSESLAALEKTLAEKAATISELEEDLSRGRADYSALLTKLTMNKYDGDDGTLGVQSPPPISPAMSAGLADGGDGFTGDFAAGSDVSMGLARPLLTDAALGKVLKVLAAEYEGTTQLPTRRGRSVACLEEEEGNTVAPPRVYAPKGFKPLEVVGVVGLSPVATTPARAAARRSVRSVSPRSGRAGRHPVTTAGTIGGAEKDSPERGSLFEALGGGGGGGEKEEASKGPNPRSSSNNGNNGGGSGSLMRDVSITRLDDGTVNVDTNATQREMAERRQRLNQLTSENGLEDPFKAIGAAGSHDDDDEDDDGAGAKSGVARLASISSEEAHVDAVGPLPLAPLAAAEAGGVQRIASSRHGRGSTLGSSAMGSAAGTGSSAIPRHSRRPTGVILPNSPAALEEAAAEADAEFAFFQAQFVGGIQLKVLGYAGRPTKARKPKVFTIRFQAKKGLTLVWSKKEGLVLSTIVSVVLGGGDGGGDGGGGGGGGSGTGSGGGGEAASSSEPGSPRLSINSGRSGTTRPLSERSGILRASFGRASASLLSSSSSSSSSEGSGSLDGAERDLVFSLVYAVPPSSPSTPPDAQNAQGADAAATSTSSLDLEATSREQRDMLARNFERLAQQERERSNMLE